MIIGDTVMRRYKDATGIVKAVHDPYITVSRIDLPMRRNCHGEMIYEVMIVHKDNLVLIDPNEVES